MLTYEGATVCPRCGRLGVSRAEEQPDDKGARLVIARCVEQSCPYYARTWFFALDDKNTVLYHTIYNI